MSKPSAVVEMEEKITNSLRILWPNVHVNVFRMDQHFFAADIIDESFTGSWMPHFRQIHEKLTKDGIIKDYLCSLCPVTPEEFGNKMEFE